MQRKIDFLNKDLGLTYVEALPQVTDSYHHRIGDGTPDFGKWASSETDWWQLPSLIINPKIKFKTHIICDPVGEYPIEYWNKFHDKYRADIYVLMGKRLKKINTSQELNYYRKFATAEKEKKVLKIAAQYQLTEVQVIVLTYGKRINLFNQLFVGEPFPVIKIADFNFFNQDLFLKQLSTVDKSMAVRVDFTAHHILDNPLLPFYFLILIDNFNVANTAMNTKNLKYKEFERIDFARLKIDTLVTKNEDGVDEIKQTNPELKHYTNKSTKSMLVKDNFKEFKMLETLTLSYSRRDKKNVSIKKIMSIVDLYPNLKKLTLNAFNVICDIDAKEISQSDKSFSLKLSGDISTENVLLLLMRYPNLNSLELTGLKTEPANYEIAIDMVKLDKLKILKLKNINQDGEFYSNYDLRNLISKILQTSPELEIFEIKNVRMAFDDRKSDYFYLSKLRILSINNITIDEISGCSPISYLFILKIIQHSKNLELLRIIFDRQQHAGELEVIPTTFEVEFPRLENIELSRVSGSFLLTLVTSVEDKTVSKAKLPKLKNLTLATIYDSVTLRPGHKFFFPELQVLTVDFVEFEPMALSSLLKSSRQLHQVKLANIKKMKLLDQYSFESLVINDNYTGPTTVEANSQVQLKFLNKNLQESFSRSLICSPQLQRLDVKFCNISQVPEELSFPHLTELSVRSVITISNYDTQPDNIKEMIEYKNQKEREYFDIIDKMRNFIISTPKLTKLTIYNDSTIAFSGIVKGFNNQSSLKYKEVSSANPLLDFSKLEELRLSGVFFNFEEKMMAIADFSQLRILSLDKVIANDINCFKTLSNLEVLDISDNTLDLQEGKNSAYLINILKNIKSIKHLIIKVKKLSNQNLYLLLKTLAGNHYHSLKITRLTEQQAKILKQEFPYADCIDKGRNRFVETKNISDFKIVKRQISSKAKRIRMAVVKLDNNVSQNKLSVFEINQYIHPNTLGVREYREEIYPYISIQKGEIVWEASKQIPVKCKKQPDLIKSLYQHYCALKSDPATADDECYYIEQTLDFPPEYADLPGVSENDEIIAYEASDDVVFHYQPDANQFFLTAESKQVEIAYLIKPKMPYLRNTINKTTFDIDLAKKLVADFRFGYDEKQNKFTIHRGKIAGKVDNVTLFKAALALTSDKETWFDKKLDFSGLKGVDLLNAIRANMTGACRHSASFIRALADALDISCSITTSIGHSFVQFSLVHKGIKTYYSEVLGGYPAEERIHQITPDQFKSKSLHNRLKINNEVKDQQYSITQKIPFEVFYDKFINEINQQSANEQTGLLYVSNDEDALLSCAGKLMEMTKRKGHRSFYIDDISKVTTETVAVKDGKEIIVGSDLNQFLQQAQPGDVLVINCPNIFSSRALLYNALDNSRHIKNMKIPPGVKILGLMEKDKIVLEYAFQRRFKVKPRGIDDLIDQQVEMPIHCLIDNITKKPIDAKPASKDFFGGDQFKQDFSGTPVFTATGSYFKPGFANDILANKDAFVEAVNLGDEREQKIILMSMMASGEVFINGEWHKDVPSFKLVSAQQEYDFSGQYTYEFLNDKNINAATYILNPKTYANFLINYGADKTNNRLLTPSGLLSNHKGQPLTIRITRSLVKKGHYKRFFDEVKKLKIKLHLIIDDDVKIPGLEIVKVKRLVLPQKSSLAIHASKTPYSDVAAFANDLKPDLIVNISNKHHSTDLIQKLKQLEAKRVGLPRYESQVGEVAELLIAGKTVLLVGDLADELAQYLETLAANPPYLMINGKAVRINGRLHLLTKNENLLRSCYQEEKKIVEVKPLPQYESKEDKIVIVDPNDEQEIRMKRVCAKLAHSPGVLLEGPTAAGKSTAVRRYLSKYYGKPIKLFEGFKSLDQFTEFSEDDNTDHILFIDECDLQEGGVFDAFEGAYNPVKPNLLAKLKAMQWKPNMKIIFTGNGKNYLARKVHEFFERHNDIRVDFQSLSMSYIRNYILKKLFLQLLPDLQDHYDNIIDIFFNASNFVIEPYVVTLRNWSQMCLRLALRPGVDILQAAKVAAYDELSTMLIEDRLPALQTSLFGSPFNAMAVLTVVDNESASELQAKLTALALKRKAIPGHDPVDQFILTPSRHHEARMIMDALKIRELRKKHLAAFPEIRYQGTYGMVLSGDSEVGKSFMVSEILQAMDFQDGKVNTLAENKYYTLTAFNQKENNQAFDEGSIVIRDEYNSTFNEDQDNGPLTAVGNDGREATKIGWALFATENTADHEGRIVATKAAANRFHHVHVKPYTIEDYQLILVGWGLPEAKAQALLSAKQIWNLGDLRVAAREQIDKHHQLQQAELELEAISLSSANAIVNEVLAEEIASLALQLDDDNMSNEIDMLLAETRVIDDSYNDNEFKITPMSDDFPEDKTPIYNCKAVLSEEIVASILEEIDPSGGRVPVSDKEYPSVLTATIKPFSFFKEVKDDNSRVQAAEAKCVPNI